MRKIFTFLLFALWLPATALAAENVPATLIVGGTDVKSGGYWTTDDDGKLTSGSESSWNVHYDASANTLNLNGATIAGANSESTLYNTVGIYASSSSGDVSLTISLQGENTITIIAKDSLGKTTTVTRHVTVDTKAPIISDVEAEATTVDANSTIHLTFKIVDPAD